MARPALRRRRLLTSLTLAASALAWTGSAAAKDAAPVPVDAGFDVAAQSASLVDGLTNVNHLKGARRVAVTQFAVEFVTNDAQSARTVAGMGYTGSSVTAHAALSGVGEAEFQAMAEAAYARFVDELKGAGLEVVPLATVQAAPGWKVVAADATPYPERGDTSFTAAPPGFVKFGLAKMDAGHQAKNQGTAGGGIFGMIQTVKAIGAVASALGSTSERTQLLKDLGDVALIDVKQQVHFMELKDDNKGFLGRLALRSSVSGKAYPSVSATTMMVSHGPAMVNLRVNAPLKLDDAAFTSAKDFDVVADPARWNAIVGDGLSAARRLVVTRIAQQALAP